MRREIPPAWQRLMDAAQVPTARKLAARMDVSTDRVTRMIHNDQTSSETLRLAATALNVNIAAIERLRQEAVYQPFELPEGAERLTATQREAVRTVVRAMLIEPLPERRTPDLRSVPQAARKGRTPRQRDNPQQ